MIRLVAEDRSIVLSREQVLRVQYQLLEFIPAVRCDVSPGPGVVIEVPGHEIHELAPGVLAAVESVMGCRVEVVGGPMSEGGPCPACGAGPEQSSNPRWIHLSVCYCGHPRYYDYKHVDGTCPCLRS